MTEPFSLLVVGAFVRYLLWETEKKNQIFFTLWDALSRKALVDILS